MTKRQEHMTIGTRFCDVADLVCSRRNPPLEGQKTKLRRAALGLLTFFSYCRDNLIDPALALLQAETIQREQPSRTSEDYLGEAKDNADAATARQGFPGSNGVHNAPSVNDHADGPGSGPGTSSRMAPGKPGPDRQADGS